MLRFAGGEGAQWRSGQYTFGTRPTGSTSEGLGDQMITGGEVPPSLPAEAALSYHCMGRLDNHPGAAHNHRQLSKSSLRCQVEQLGQCRTHGSLERPIRSCVSQKVQVLSEARRMEQAQASLEFQATKGNE